MRNYFYSQKLKVFWILAIPLSLAINNNAHAQLCNGTTVILENNINYEDPAQWILVFDEEFNSDTLDLFKWQLVESSQGNRDGTGAYYSLDNIVVSPETFYGENTTATGICRIISKREQVTKFPVNWDPFIPEQTYQYTSSYINTIEKFGWGKYEIRCKIPKGKGLWPAFWLYGEENYYFNEIDIFEFWNEKNLLGQYEEKKLSKNPMMHYHCGNTLDINNRFDLDCGSTHNTDIDFSLDYHTYSVIWNRFGIYWYIDDQLIKNASQWYSLEGIPINEHNIKPIQIAIRNDCFPKMDMAMVFDIKIQSGKNEPDDETQFPANLDVDYIRFYKSL